MSGAAARTGKENYKKKKQYRKRDNKLIGNNYQRNMRNTRNSIITVNRGYP